MQINIPQQKKQDIVDAFCSVYNYKIEDSDGKMIPNPQSKEEFFLVQLKKFIEDVYIIWKLKNYQENKGTLETTSRQEFKNDFNL